MDSYYGGMSAFRIPLLSMSCFNDHLDGIHKHLRSYLDVILEVILKVI